MKTNENQLDFGPAPSRPRRIITQRRDENAWSRMGPAHVENISGMRSSRCTKIGTP